MLSVILYVFKKIRKGEALVVPNCV